MPVKNKIGDLRNHLFETLEALKDQERPMDLDRARAVAEVARAIVDSAKVEVEFLKVTGQMEGTGFLPAGPPPPDGEEEDRDIPKPKRLGAGPRA